MNPSTISSWKTKNNIPPIETLCIICDYFDISLDYLIKGQNFHSNKEYDLRKKIFSEIDNLKNNIEIYL